MGKLYFWVENVGALVYNSLRVRWVGTDVKIIVGTLDG